MSTMVCVNCGFIYDPAVGDSDRGVPPGTSFDALPDEWTCPLCYAAKEMFDPL